MRGCQVPINSWKATLSGQAVAALLAGIVIAALGGLAIVRATALANWNNTAGPAWMHRGQIRNTPRMFTVLGACFVVAGMVLIIPALIVR